MASDVSEKSRIARDVGQPGADGRIETVLRDLGSKDPPRTAVIAKYLIAKTGHRLLAINDFLPYA
jgi:hypothetical protein